MGDSDSGDTTSEAPRLVVEEPSVDPPEKTAFLDNGPFTVEQDSLQRSVKATRLTKDLRLREPHSPRPARKIKENNTSADLSWYRNVSHRCRFVPVQKCLAFVMSYPSLFTWHSP